VQIIVQEGEASVSLTAPIQAPDSNLRSSTVTTIIGPVKVFYRDYEIVKIEAKDGELEVLPTVIGAVSWLAKGQRYQLKPAGQ
jgi:hypothetical protein